MCCQVILFIFLFLAVTSPNVGQEIQCAQELYRPCRALCGEDIFLDISYIFRYPVTINDSDRNYEYTFSPCLGISVCSEVQNFSAVCQTNFERTANWSLGSMLYVNWFLNQTNPYSFVVNYQQDGLRKTRVIFTEDPTADPAVLVFIAETPTLEYLFEVRGKNIGQPQGAKEIPFPLRNNKNKKPSVKNSGRKLNTTFDKKINRFDN